MFSRATRRSSAIGARGCLVAVATLLTTTLTTTAGPASDVVAQTVDDFATITVLLDAEPGAAAALDVRLILDGDDVTADYCATGDETGYDGVLRCAGLPDAVAPAPLYEVVVDGMAGAQRLHSRCSDIVAGSGDVAGLPIDPTNGTGLWTCVLTVSRPGVVVGIGIFAVDAPDLPGAGVELVPPAGASVECAADVYNGEDVDRCAVSAEGDYRLAISGSPRGYIAVPYCETIAGRFRSNSTGIAAVDDDNWLWVCTFDTIVPTVTINVFSETGQPWIDALELAVAGPAGDVGGRCREINRNEDASFVEFACPFSRPGDYEVAIVPPEGFSLDAPGCTGFTLPADPVEPIACNQGLIAPEPPPSTTAPTTAPTTVPVALPATGGRAATAGSWAGALAALAGVALIVAARRRHA